LECKWIEKESERKYINRVIGSTDGRSMKDETRKRNARRRKYDETAASQSPIC